jgi:hypothetical protein
MDLLVIYSGLNPGVSAMDQNINFVNGGQEVQIPTVGLVKIVKLHALANATKSPN